MVSGAYMTEKTHRLERIRINGQTIAIRAIVRHDDGPGYSKQFVVNATVDESAALQMARDYVKKMKEKPVAIPSEKEVMKAAEKVVEDAKIRDEHNAKARAAASSDVAFVLKRYATTSVFGYFNTSGDWTQ